MSLASIPLFDRLAGARSVLIAGAGGGFDVYAGLPLALELIEQGKDIHLANWSFASLADPRFWVMPGLARVLPDSHGDDDYFPERTLARWLERQGLARPVYAFTPTGVKPLREMYRTLARELALDAAVLVDGGTDILMRGDEAGLGTPAEDMTSLAALTGLEEIPTRLVACIGFGIDAHHGVNHTQVLENIAQVSAAGGYLGAFSVPPNSREALLYLDAVEDAARSTPHRSSIVNGQIAAAIRGESGNVPLGQRTAESELFVNPLISMYFTFDLEGLAAANLYLRILADTEGPRQVNFAIEAFRYDITRRERRFFPH